MHVPLSTGCRYPTTSSPASIGKPCRQICEHNLELESTHACASRTCVHQAKQVSKQASNGEGWKCKTASWDRPRLMPFLFLSFPFLSFPFLSFPFLSFPFLSSSPHLLFSSFLYVASQPASRPVGLACRIVSCHNLSYRPFTATQQRSPRCNSNTLCHTHTLRLVVEDRS